MASEGCAVYRKNSRLVRAWKSFYGGYHRDRDDRTVVEKF
jgi:hypothetical protein